MAENFERVGRAMAPYITTRLNISAEFADNVPYQDRERLFDEKQIQLCWLCGLHYIWKAASPEADLELLAAPVMAASRYKNKPVYFSDVVVHKDSPFHTFADLRGASWAYNEIRSHSGYNITRYHLTTLNEPPGYFGRVVKAGGHQAALHMILSRQIDASAIDSTLLGFELHCNPAITDQIRIIDTLGPSPIPPWVIQKNLPQPLKNNLRALFLTMHHTPTGRAVLDQGLIAKFVPVQDQDYNLIRTMANKAELATL